MSRTATLTAYRPQTASKGAKAILMHQELDPNGLAHVRGKIHRLVNPGLAAATLMENGLKDVAVAIGDVSVLPVEINGVSGAIPMPEA